MAFLLHPEPSRKDATMETLIRKNRQNAIPLLKSLSEKQQPQLTETCIMVWGQLGRIADEEELNLVLAQLLEYLGDSSNIFSAFAFNELTTLAGSKGISPRRLLDPYWRNLAYVTTKEMVNRPQRSRAVAELLQISVNELLLLIQTYALPWLVLDKRQDVILKITEARRKIDPLNNDPWDTIIYNQNLATIIPLLLIQDVEDGAGFAKSRLDATSSKFEETTLVDLIRTEPVLISMEFLKAAGDADPSRKSLVCHKSRCVDAVLI